MISIFVITIWAGDDPGGDGDPGDPGGGGAGDGDDPGDPGGAPLANICFQ